MGSGEKLEGKGCPCFWPVPFNGEERGLKHLEGDPSVLKRTCEWTAEISSPSPPKIQESHCPKNKETSQEGLGKLCSFMMLALEKDLEKKLHGVRSAPGLSPPSPALRVVACPKHRPQRHLPAACCCPLLGPSFSVL